MTETIQENVRALMPEVVADLGRLVRIPSIAFPDFPPEPLQEAHDLVVELLRGAGVEELVTLNLPDTAPVVTGTIPAPPARRRCCSTRTTTSSRPATSRSGARRRGSRPSATVRSSGAARPTPRRT